MGSHDIILTIYFVILINHACAFGNSDLDTQYKVHHFNNLSRNINYTDYVNLCKIKTCIPKCCPLNTYVYRRNTCRSYNATRDTVVDFSNVKVYNNGIDKVIDTLNNRFTLVPGKFDNATFKSKAYGAADISYNFYLTETGILYAELPNAYLRWTPRDNSNFCVDYQISSKKGRKPVPKFWVIFDTGEEPKSYINVTPEILVSCVFMLLVLVVYSLLPELRNICGLILMAYVASLFGAFLLLAIAQTLQRPTTNMCLGLTYLSYFFILASFCWMNVMSFDIWWTFRGCFETRSIHRRGKKFKFLMYCMYAWGLPLAMTLGLAFINSMNLKHMPWIINPGVPSRGCYLNGGEKLLYLYIPILIMIISNWIFYLMTAFNLWRLNRDISGLDSSSAGRRASYRQRLMVYLKIFVVMGLSWVLEVVSFLSPKFRVWQVTNIYNSLIGLAIFLIFVCKKKIFRKLMKRFRRSKVSLQTATFKSYTSSSIFDCSSSRDTSRQTVCANLNGPI